MTNIFDNFDAFSLFDTQISIARFTGVLNSANGIYERTQVDTILTSGSAQPYKTIEGEAIFDPTSGVNIQKVLLVYTSIEIFMDDKTNSNPTADILTIDGRDWEPISVNNWNFSEIGHYRTVARLFDGN